MHLAAVPVRFEGASTYKPSAMYSGRDEGTLRIHFARGVGDGDLGGVVDRFLLLTDDE